MKEEKNDRLKTDIETALHRQMKTPKDFDYLRERIFARLHVLLSRTTLMRLWGYVAEPVAPRESTLDVLARFLGYCSWTDYQAQALLPKEQQSSPVMSRRLSVAAELCRGDRLRLTWQPDRVCDVVSEGGTSFRVEASANTRLGVGDTFECGLIIEDEPLYIDNLRQQGRPPVAYVCGKRSGVRYEFLA